MRMLVTLSLLIALSFGQLSAEPSSANHSKKHKTLSSQKAVQTTKTSQVLQAQKPNHPSETVLHSEVKTATHKELHATDAHSEHGDTHAEHGDLHAEHGDLHAEHGDPHAEHGDPHGSEEHSNGEKVRHVIEHHLTDGTLVELPFLNIDLHNLKIRAPFLDNLHASTREGNPLIYWMVEDGHAYIPVTKHIAFMWLALALVILVLLAARRTAGTSRPRGIGNVIEVFILFIRDEVVLPNTGEAGRKYMPFFLTTFFFILFMNLLGMIPFGASATGNLSVTAGLALCAFVFMQVTGIRAYGFLGHFKGLMPGGVPMVIAPILVPIEFLGMFTKPFALCVRLFANMMAGHAVIAAFLGLILVPAIALASLPVSIAISMLELFVAFLQAYIFTMLTAIFAGTFMHQH
jgi:F-type H+-transporting ATPase subunit a